jgi:archaellin
MKNLFFVLLLLATILVAGCIETGRTTQSDNYIVGKISVTEVTYLWGDDGLFTKQYVVSYQAVGSPRQSTTISKAEYESIKNGLVGYFLPDFGYPVSPSPTMPFVVQTTMVPTYTQKMQETVYKGVTQSTANIQMIGNVYGLSEDNSTITSILFSIGLAPGAPAIDLTKMYIVLVTGTANSVILTEPVILTQGTNPSSTVFVTLVQGTQDTSLKANERADIIFKTTPIKANTKIVIGLHPAVGAELLFTKYAPAKISSANVLY